MDGDQVVKPDFKKILAETAYPDPGLTPEQQQGFINRYSFSALVLQFIYYFAMGDALLAWLSIICSVVFIFAPLLVILPIFARRRAYAHGQWASFGHFYQVQKRWDRNGLYLVIATTILGVITLWLIGPMILRSVSNLTGGQPTSSDVTEQLQNTLDSYRDILGR